MPKNDTESKNWKIGLEVGLVVLVSIDDDGDPSEGDEAPADAPDDEDEELEAWDPNVVSLLVLALLSSLVVE